MNLHRSDSYKYTSIRILDVKYTCTLIKCLAALKTIHYKFTEGFRQVKVRLFFATVVKVPKRVETDCRQTYTKI